MNIHKSCIIAVLLGCIFATQAYASSESVDRCNVLLIHINNDILDNYFVSADQIVMNRGVNQGCRDEEHGIFCRFLQSQAYGPDATLSFKRITDGQIAKIRVQQNFCFFEAGNITVTPLSGKWIYSIREGSWGDKRHGDVWLDQVKCC